MSHKVVGKKKIDLKWVPILDPVNTGRKITELRLKRGLSVRELADYMGFESPVAVYKWQHGVTVPNMDNIVVLAAIFGVRIDDIIARKYYEKGAYTEIA